MAILLAVLALASGAAVSAGVVADNAPEPSGPGQNCAPIDVAGVTRLFDEWNLALASLDPDAVAARYWPEAVLLASSSNEPRTSHLLIREYFSHFLGEHPRAHVDSRSVQLGCNLAIDSGSYTFSLMSETGSVSELPARYTFVYQYRDGAWKILHQHSSLMPDSGAAPNAPGGPEVAAFPIAAGVFAGTAKGTGAAAAAAAPSGAAAHKSKRIAKVENTRETQTPPDGSPRTSWSAMFLNQSGSPDVEEFYPKSAQADGERGVISMRVCADPHGRIAGDPQVLKGSGHADLDAAAEQWARAARWIPATENGSAVEGCTRVSIQFGS